MTSKEIWEVYPEVYHYTKFSSALLILHSATLRATRHDLLNDTQEIIYAKGIIVQKYYEKFPDTSFTEAKSLMEDIFSVIMAMGDFYITSFCGINTDTDHYHRDNGLLSMWRNYGTDGGCAIVFKTQNIYEETCSYGEPILNSFYGMKDVIYKGKNEGDPDYNESLDRFTKNAQKLETNRARNLTEMPFDETKKILEDLLYLMIRSKHPAFFEEREVRIGLCFMNEDGNQSNPQLFHEIPFSPVQDITRIIIGPHRDKKERCDFLKSYLSKINPNIEVTMSEIPLRV